MSRKRQQQSKHMKHSRGAEWKGSLEKNTIYTEGAAQKARTRKGIAADAKRKLKSLPKSTSAFCQCP